MKRKLFFPVATILLGGLLYAGCSKSVDSPGSTSELTATNVTTVQNAEAQETVSDQVEQSVDNTTDAIESNKFTSVATSYKSGLGGFSWGIDKPTSDTSKITFPKVITLTYNNTDTIGSEHISLSGTVTVTIDTIPVGKKSYWRNHVKRTIKFTDLTVTTDSASYVLNGTRMMYRLVTKVTQSSNLRMRAEAIDSIASDYSLKITSGTSSSTVTRTAQRTRDAISYFNRTTTTSRWAPDLASDTVKITGSAAGVNSSGVAYTRVITTPIVITYSQTTPHTPVILSGIITYTVGSDTYTITYAGGSDGIDTDVTVSKGGNSKSFTRKCGRKMGKGMF